MVTGTRLNMMDTAVSDICEALREFGESDAAIKYAVNEHRKLLFKYEAVKASNRWHAGERERLLDLLRSVGEAGGEKCATCRGTRFIVSHLGELDDLELEIAIAESGADGLDECDNPTCFGGWEVEF